MHAVLLVVHVIIALSLIGIILIQRSDSDGFGLGSGSGSNFMTGRSAANFLTRTTAILATLFIINALVLGIMASHHTPTSIVDQISEEQEQTIPATPEQVKEATKPGPAPTTDKTTARKEQAAHDEAEKSDKKEEAPAVKTKSAPTSDKQPVEEKNEPSVPTE